MTAFLSHEIQEFNRHFQSDFKSNVPLLDIILKYIIRAKGKQMRPRFVLTSAAMFGTINEITYAAASLIELLHTATLVHDDVVDDGHMRRHIFSINALWKNKIAVLVGDYLLSKGMINALEGNHFELLKIVSNAVRLMSEGELLQIEKARKLDIKEDIYFEIIKNKTASLLSAACASGAYSTSHNDSIKHRMSEFGTAVGIAFQIKDDLLDYGTDDIGKPIGIDIKEKKMTLPLIFTLNNIDHKEKRRIISLIKNKSDKKDSVSYIVNCVKKNGGIEYAEEKMNSYISSALAILYEFPESEAKTEMTKLVTSTIDRIK